MVQMVLGMKQQLIMKYLIIMEVHTMFGMNMMELLIN